MTNIKALTKKLRAGLPRHDLKIQRHFDGAMSGARMARRKHGKYVLAAFAEKKITDLLDHIERLEAALELFARLEPPEKPVGNAGIYSIPYERIHKARAALANTRGEHNEKVKP